MEQIELEAVAFLIILEDVASQAPGVSSDKNRTDHKGEWLTPAPKGPAPLTLRLNPEISASGRMRDLLEIAEPADESSSPREHRQPQSMEAQIGPIVSSNERAPDTIRESVLRIAGNAGLPNEIWPLTTDDRHSRPGLEADDQAANPFRMRRETASDAVHQDAETDSQAPGRQSPYAIASAELHIPEGGLTSSGPMPVAGEDHALLAVGEVSKRIPPTARFWRTHRSEPIIRETGSKELEKSPDADPSPASIAAPMASEENPYTASRTKQRRAAKQQSQNRELARRIAWLENQLGLKTNADEIQDPGAYPRLCYPL